MMESSQNTEVFLLTLISQILWVPHRLLLPPRLDYSDRKIKAPPTSILQPFINMQMITIIGTVLMTLPLWLHCELWQQQVLPNGRRPDLALTDTSDGLTLVNRRRFPFQRIDHQMLHQMVDRMTCLRQTRVLHLCLDTSPAYASPKLPNGIFVGM